MLRAPKSVQTDLGRAGLGHMAGILSYSLSVSVGAQSTQRLLDLCPRHSLAGGISGEARVPQAALPSSGPLADSGAVSPPTPPASASLGRSCLLPKRLNSFLPLPVPSPSSLWVPPVLFTEHLAPACRLLKLLCLPLGGPPAPPPRVLLLPAKFPAGPPTLVSSSPHPAPPAPAPWTLPS